MPPVATTGTVTASTTCGTSASVPTSTAWRRDQGVDAEGPVRQRADARDRLLEPIGCEVGAGEAAEPARVRDRGDELRRRRAASHRCLQDRQLDSEPVAEPRAQAQRGRI